MNSEPTPPNHTIPLEGRLGDSFIIVSDKDLVKISIPDGHFIEHAISGHPTKCYDVTEMIKISQSFVLQRGCSIELICTEKNRWTIFCLIGQIYITEWETVSKTRKKRKNETQ